MTDVRDAPSPSLAQDNQPNPKGDFIWYELMTTDADGAKAFYDAVVGWNIGEGAPEFQGYRMIGRSDGKFAGGVLPLTDEMRQHGARPTWLGYIHVPDVDRAARGKEQDVRMELTGLLIEDGILRRDLELLALRRLHGDHRVGDAAARRHQQLGGHLLLTADFGILGDLDLPRCRRCSVELDGPGERAAVGHGDRLVGRALARDGGQQGEGGQDKLSSHHDLLLLGAWRSPRPAPRAGVGLTDSTRPHPS